MKKLFEPVAIGKLTVKNRIMMAPMDLGFAEADGLVNDRVIDFYAERAEGEAGLIVAGGAYPQKGVAAMSHVLNAYSDEVIPGFIKLNETLHKSGAKTALQLLHPGRYAHPIFNRGKQPISSSAVRPTRVYTELLPRELSIDEIREAVMDFARSAKRVKEGGFDAVEIHAGMGYLISQFLSPAVNRRTDCYGGNFENRTRFACEIIDNIKKICGNDFPVIARISGDEVMEGGNGLEECARIAAILEKAGADAIAIIPGWQESRINCIGMHVPEASYAYMARRIKSGLTVPLAAGARVRDVKIAEEILLSCDMICWGRPLIADPALPKKIKEEKPVRRCISCNYCFDEMISMRPVACAVNPLVGLEGKVKIVQAEKSKKVAVVGAGPAGLEAALSADERGHAVYLFDEKDEIGGCIGLCASPPGRGENIKVFFNYADRIKKSGVRLSLGRAANPAAILDLNPDVLIVAAGGEPVVPQIKGIKRSNVVFAEEVLSGKIIPGKKVAVVGGGLVGVETALFVSKLGAMSPDSAVFLLNHEIIGENEVKMFTARGGREVFIIEMMSKIGRGFGKSSRWVILQEAEKCGIKALTNTQVLDILEDKIIIKGPGGESELLADTVIIAAGYKSRSAGFSSLEGKIPEIYFIGDAARPGRIADAVRQGFEIGRKI